jgi:hypothetical protein
MQVRFPLPTKTFTAGGQDVIPLRDLPKTLYGRICHLAAIVFTVTLTPTYTTAPTVIGTNNIVQSCDIYDGQMYRFNGGFNEMRLKEFLAVGRLRVPDPDADTASATARYFRRVWHVGPPQMAGGQDNAGTDFVIPCAALTDGECRITYGALTDISADTTAATGTIAVTAVLSLLDEVRIPPAYQFYFQTLNAADVNLPGRAMYESLAMCDAATMSAITAGDFGNFTLDLGFGDVVPTVASATLGDAFADDRQGGHIPSLAGEPAAASDDNAKGVNAATPTALTTAGRIVQPILWTPNKGKITKLLKADGIARLRWSGTQTSGFLLIGRILEQPPAVSGAMAQKALNNLGRASKGTKVKTLSKVDYKGPNGAFMPLDLSV